MTLPVLPNSYVNGDVYSASAVNDANTVINTLSATQSLIAAKGDILTGSADDTLVKTGIGANNTVLYADSTTSGGVAWGLITSAMITDGTITATDSAGATITGAKIASATITGSNIAATTIAASNIVANTITSGQCKADGAATSILSVGTALPSALSSKLHFGTTTPASGTGAIGDIYIQY